MATPSPQLINLLLKTADDIETNPDYDWHETENCNCGLLAKNAGCPVVIDRILVIYNDSWQNMAHRRCSKTGILLIDAVKNLISYGLTSDDIGDLEMCRNPEILKMIKAPRNYESPTFVASYLRAWAALLDQQLLAQSLAGLQASPSQVAKIAVSV